MEGVVKSYGSRRNIRNFEDIDREGENFKIIVKKSGVENLGLNLKEVEISLL